jgi:parallel beta-helix repeat protein
MVVWKGSISLLLLLAMFGALFVTPAAANPTTRSVPTSDPTIQALINAAKPGSIVNVPSGTYYEHVIVNKSLTLIGENMSTTIIDGNGTGLVIRSSASNVEIKGFTIQNGGSYPYGEISIGNSVNNTICDNIIRNNGVGITLIGSNACSITNNLIMNCSWTGIQITDSNSSLITGNTIENNSWAVSSLTTSSSFNTFYHNNFINNLNEVQEFSTTDKWNNSEEGNYWSDYTGKDLTGSGIGDTLLPWQGLDWHPLMEPWSPIRRFYVNPYNVTTFSNSTVASFSFNQTLKQTSFNVTSGFHGFCNVTIPRELLDGNFTVLIGGVQVNASVLVITKNSTYSSLYFSYNSGVHHVEIYGTTVVSAYGVTFNQLGVGTDFTGTVVTIDGIGYNVTGLPVSFMWINGSNHNFSFASPLVVNASKQYVWTSTSGLSTLQSGTLTVTGSGNVTGNYTTQTMYQITFNQSGINSDYTGTVIVIDGTNYNRTALPVSFMWKAGSVHNFTFQSPLTISPNSKQYVWNSTSGLSTLRNGTITVSTSGSIVGNYKTQYYLTVTSPHDSPTPSNGWFNSGTSITESVTSPVSGGSGTQYICTGWTGTGSVPVSGSTSSVIFTITQASNITWNWKTQYQVTFPWGITILIVLVALAILLVFIRRARTLGKHPQTGSSTTGLEPNRTSRLMA